METISAVILTKNESANIERCIDSLLGVTAEIIVIDSFSTDNTKELCEKYDTVRFVERTFIDYSDAKNYGNSLVKHDWILSIDADEALSPTLIESINKIRTKGTSDGYYFNRCTNYCGKWIRHGGWYPEFKLRLWKKKMANWQGAIHETLAYTGKKPIKLNGDLLHYSYPSIASHAEKVNRYSTLMAQDLFNKGKKKPGFIKLILSPLFELIKKLVLKRGFMDGYYGFVIAVLSSVYVFLKYAKLRSLVNQKNK